MPELEARLIRYRPGDRIVVCLPWPHITAEQAAHIRETVRAGLDLPDVPVAIITGGMGVFAVAPEEGELNGMETAGG